MVFSRLIFVSCSKLILTLMDGEFFQQYELDRLFSRGDGRIARQGLSGWGVLHDFIYAVPSGV